MKEVDYIPGNYQFTALHEGPISQRLWHRSKFALMEDVLSRRLYQTICDVGCGSGVVTHFVASALPDSRVVGYDINKECVNFALNHFGTRNAFFAVRDFMRVPKPEEERFEFIYSLEVIEHFSPKNVPVYLAHLHQMGCKQAQYLLTTPDYSSIWPFIEKTLDLLRLTPRMAGHQHLSRFTRALLKSSLESCGFEIQRMYNFCGMAPFFGHISLKAYQSVAKIEKRLGYGNLIACEFNKK